MYLWIWPFFCSYDHILQIRFVTVERKVKLSYHKKIVLLEPDWIRKQRFFRFSFPSTRQRRFQLPKTQVFENGPQWEVFSKRRLILIINHTARALRGMISCFLLAFSRRRAKTIQMGYVWTFTSLICCLVPKFFVLESKNRFINRYKSHVGNNFVNAACVISKTALKLIV